MVHDKTSRSQDLLDRILDAAESCFDRFGVEKTSMEEVATAADLSRGYVYKRLGTRDGLVLAVLVRRASRFAERARSFVASRASLADALVDGILLAVTMADRDPYFGMLVGSAVLDPEHQLPGAPQAARRLTDETWRPTLEAARERRELSPEVDIDDLVLWIMNLQIALLANRRSFDHTDAMQERQLRTLLVPAVCAGPFTAVPATEEALRA